MSEDVLTFPKDSVLLRNGYIYVQIVGVQRKIIEKDTSKGFSMSLYEGGEDLKAIRTALLARKDLGLPYAKIWLSVAPKKSRRRPQ